MSLIVLASLVFGPPPKSKPKPKPKPKPPVSVPMRLDVDVKPNESVSGERAFRVKVQSTDPVTQVEMYVGDDLRDSDNSTPYEFRIDTLEENDGPLRLKWRAYNNKGKSAERIVTILVNNDIGIGAAAHVERGLTALSSGDTAKAINEGRIALKADPKDYGAKMLLARAYYQRNEYDRAQKYAEDAEIVKKNDQPALNLKSAISIRRAFSIVGRGDGKPVGPQIAEALKTGVEARRRSLEVPLDLPAATELTIQADRLLDAGRYNAAISLLADTVSADQGNLPLAHRLAYAQIRAGRWSDADGTLRGMLRRAKRDEKGQPDIGAYGEAVAALVRAYQGDTIAADAALTRALARDKTSLAVRSAQAYLALRRNDDKGLAALTKSMNDDAGAKPEAAFYSAVILNRAQNYGDARKALLQAALAEPAMGDVYLEAGLQSLALSETVRDPAPIEQMDESQLSDEEKRALEKMRKDREAGVKAAEARRKEFYGSAKAFFEAALAAKPDSLEALAALVSVSGLEGNPSKALEYGRQVGSAGPDSAVAQYALAGALANRAKGGTQAQAAELLREASQAAIRASNLDPRSLGGRSAPSMTDLWRYLMGPGRAPVIPSPTTR